MRRWILLALIIGLGFFLRAWKLGTIPEGFYSDEALYGYEAYSLLRTGKDQFGHPWPVSIAGFGDYRPAFYVYTTIPFIAAFGLSEWSTRLPTAVFSIATIIAVFFLAKEISRNSKVSLLSALLMSLSPWHIYFSRMAHETSLVTFLITLGTIGLYRSRTKQTSLVPALICFVLAMYTYHSARVFVPLALIVWFIINRSYYHKKIPFTGLTLIAFGLSLVPMVLDMVRGGGSRIQNISLWTDPGAISAINSLRGKMMEVGIPVDIGRLIVNKATYYTHSFAKNFLSHFSLQFLLTRGDPNEIYNTPHTGILLWTEPVFILIGLIYMWFKQRGWLWFTILFTVIALVPDSLTRLAPSSARMHLALPFICFGAGVGSYAGLRKSKLLFCGLWLLTIVSHLWFWQNYLVVRPIAYEQTWQTGTKSMIQQAVKLSPEFDKIWISRTGWGWIHILFHTQYDPALFQNEVKVSAKNEHGFWWVSDVGKFHLDWLPQQFTVNTLYIGRPEEFPPGIIPKSVVHYPDGQAAFYLITVSELQTVCKSCKVHTNN